MIKKIISNPAGRPTEAQKKAMNKLGLVWDSKTTQRQASEMIKREIQFINETEARVSRVKHGFYPSPGGGGIVYRHGVMEYCDDGNGNEWNRGDDEWEDERP